jgi:hypothetical protein
MVCAAPLRKWSSCRRPTPGLLRFARKPNVGLTLFAPIIKYYAFIIGAKTAVNSSIMCKKGLIMNDDLVTIVGSSYLEPISVLLENLYLHNKGNKNPVQAGYYVNGFPSSICILSVILLESYVMRVRYPYVSE